MSGSGGSRLRALIGGPGGQLRVAAEDALVQGGQHGPGFGALLVDQAAACFPVEAEGVAWPAAPVQSLHLVADQGFVERILSQEVMQLAEQVGVPAKFEFALHPLQDG